MKGIFTILLLSFLSVGAGAQHGFAFTHITTEDGTGLASNLVTSIYQDERGFIWVGTANGLQRFDGSKFIEISTSKPGSDNLQHNRISQIIPADEGKLLLAMFGLREFGLFDPATFIYKKIRLQPARPVSPRAEYRLWKDSRGEIYLNVSDYGVLHYNRQFNTFTDDRPFPFPAGWKIQLLGAYENVQKQQYWFACDSGLCIYDKSSRQMWSRKNNPLNLPVLHNERLQDGLSTVYIDRQKRIWLFSWPWAGDGGQYRYCLDSTGSRFLQKDTLGLNYGAKAAADYKFFFETSQGEFWIYGLNALLNFDKDTNRFHYNKTTAGKENINIDYESVFQLMEDKDGNLWLATNQGIYYTAAGSANSSVENITFNQKGPGAITDILEVPGGNLWFTSLRTGVSVLDRAMHPIETNVYRQPPPADWPAAWKAATHEGWSLCRETNTGNIWIGCNNGVLMIYNPAQGTTEYLHPSETDNGTIKYITEDKYGNIWIGTAGGRLVKWDGKEFTVAADINTIIYKIFIDDQGWLWLATQESGLYAINPANGKILQHYTVNKSKNSLYSNTGYDIEQMQNGLIAFGAGALHFINKKTGAVTRVSYEDGLPSNTIARLRLDDKGFLWIITSNGLCRYNPDNNRITPYTSKDGFIFAEQAIAADYRLANGDIVFGGSNTLLMFNPAAFVSTRQPRDVTITDFKVFNQYLPVDSLMRNSQIKLGYDQNSLSIYFASLNYKERDKLTYYYKMEGVDKGWIKADRSYFVNYSLLPSGKYTFNIYCENIEGRRSKNITQLNVYIKPPFWKSLWFMSSLLFLVCVLIYVVHNLRVNRLLAVEALRNRVARDLHDDMGSTLSTINILSSMAKSKMATDAVKTSEYINKISEYSEKMMDAMDDIVWSIKPSNDSMQKITARMREFATNVLEAKEIEFDFVVDAEIEDVKLNMEARRDFFLVFKEAVNNAAKYSRARSVLIQLNMQNKKLSLLIKDNGAGFDLAEADGNGLGNMKKRADNLNGYVSIQSKKGEGTAVKLIIPVL